MDRKVRTVYLPMGISTTCARRNFAVLNLSELSDYSVYERKDAMYVFDSITEARGVTTIENPISLWTCEVIEDELVKFVTAGGFIYYKTKRILHPRRVKGNIYKYSDKGGNAGHQNVGEENIGTLNTGKRNDGIGNVGSSNSGRSNYGRHNTGAFNTGLDNYGSFNNGYQNNGRGNVGNRNSGIRNIGILNVGRSNVGRNNIGHLNIGNGNIGCCNVTNSAIGFFNTEPCTEFRIFDEHISADDYDFEDIMELMNDYANYIYPIGAEKVVKHEYNSIIQTTYPMSYNEDRTTHIPMPIIDKRAPMDNVHLVTESVTFNCLIADLENLLPYEKGELAEKLSKLITCKPMNQIKKEQKI